MEEVIKAWTNRHNLVHSARFSWTETRTEVKGSRLNPRMHKAVNPKGLTMPDKDSTYEVESRLIYDREKWRYSFRNASWNPESMRQGIPQELLWVFNGKISKFYSAPEGERQYPEGSTTQKEIPSKFYSWYKPLFWAYQIPDKTVPDFDLAELRISPRHGIIEMRNYLILEQGKATSKKTSVWVDPARDFMIGRFIEETKGNVLFQCDISYRLDESLNLWIPRSWVIAVAQSDGSPLLSGTAHLKDYAINPKIDPAEFEYDFPEGTWVNSDEGMYIQRAGGKKRFISREEFGASYEQYLTTETGQGLSRNRGMGMRLWLLVLVVGTAAVVVVALLIKRRKRFASGVN
jgi:hypothetical protein